MNIIIFGGIAAIGLVVLAGIFKGNTAGAQSTAEAQACAATAAISQENFELWTVAQLGGGRMTRQTQVEGRPNSLRDLNLQTMVFNNPPVPAGVAPVGGALPPAGGAPAALPAATPVVTLPRPILRPVGTDLYVDAITSIPNTGLLLMCNDGTGWASHGAMLPGDTIDATSLAPVAAGTKKTYKFCFSTSGNPVDNGPIAQVTR